MADFIVALDALLTEQGFAVSPTVDSSMKHYNKGNSTLVVQPDTYRRDEISNGNQNYRGSHLSFTLEGQVKPKMQEQIFRRDLREFKWGFNDRYIGDGTQIRDYSSVPLYEQEGRVPNREVRVPILLLEYKEGTSPDKIAALIAEIQAGLFELMAKYIEQ